MPQMRIPKRTAIFNNNFADISTLDRGDIDAILSTNGLMPLSKIERAFLEDMEYSLKITTDKLLEIGQKLKSDKNLTANEKNKLYEDISEIVQNNSGILGLGVSNLGCGLKLKRIEQ